MKVEELLEERKAIALLDDEIEYEKPRKGYTILSKNGHASFF